MVRVKGPMDVVKVRAPLVFSIIACRRHIGLAYRLTLSIALSQNLHKCPPFGSFVCCVIPTYSLAHDASNPTPLRIYLAASAKPSRPFFFLLLPHRIATFSASQLLNQLPTNSNKQPAAILHFSISLPPSIDHHKSHITHHLLPLIVIHHN